MRFYLPSKTEQVDAHAVTEMDTDNDVIVSPSQPGTKQRKNDGCYDEVTYYVPLPSTADKCLSPSHASIVFSAATVSSDLQSATADIEADRRPALLQNNISIRGRSEASTTHVLSPGSVCEQVVRRQSLIPVRQSPAASTQQNQQGTAKDGTKTPEVQPTLRRSTPTKKI
ncbi:hypothetical protein PoB_000103600 [Plakobranchus ocellatus]|uniref:Uncharacterized protein n=1 Tax=Plakobranchus ocellatus TaxID=259542 RepID=A0AAV3XWT0_9GAST|nr:hypothetical protein PoB_000103600 [Plakobranchus ocellatus]